MVGSLQERVELGEEETDISLGIILRILCFYGRHKSPLLFVCTEESIHQKPSSSWGTKSDSEGSLPTPFG